MDATLRFALYFHLGVLVGAVERAICVHPKYIAEGRSNRHKRGNKRATAKFCLVYQTQKAANSNKLVHIYTIYRR